MGRAAVFVVGASREPGGRPRFAEEVASRSPGASVQVGEPDRVPGADLVVALDGDALPLHDRWLGELAARLDGGAPASGAWEDDRGVCIAVPAARLGEPDTLAAFRCALSDPVARRLVTADGNGLARTDHNALPGGDVALYGDLVYHQRADDPELARRAAAIALDHGDAFAAWLRGPGDGRVVLVLGMHRSGTSCLMACLEQCGVDLGQVERRNYGQVGGNLEQHQALLVNEALLAGAGGTWRDPPATVATSGATQAAAIASIAAQLEAAAPSALKDPRTLFTVDAWLGAMVNPALVGTFRHPEAVARSLWERERMPPRQAHDLWRRYNDQLVARHRETAFPLVEFDLSDRAAYCRTVAGVAVELGLPPRLPAALAVVEQEFSRTRVPPGAAVPSSCAELHAYLREHGRGEPAPGSLAALLAEYFVAAEPAPGRSLLRSVEAWGWSRIRHLPRPLRQGAYRALRRLRVRGGPS